MSDSTLKRVKQSFGDQLDARYEAVVQCKDCANTFTMVFKRPEDIRTHGICVICSEDYK